MWGTSCCPYLSRPVILILPWLFGCQEEQAVKPVGESSSGRVSCARAPRGLGNSRFAYNWTEWKLRAVRHAT
ncbi:hypothetical protein CgunFtcFv8_007815 [Champsocephalus gunnari]|uniref:Secreted protein n=1 Tax=Champsocephalus gunnari TaxID=52237 RepID=A0AAN8CHZ4_CHAGU|nr:hypothetical protein CgunFtcFv8_007815 [Champsocephalus gunnari]